VNTEFLHHVFRVCEHIHQVRDRRSLVAPDVGDTRLQQRLGDRENAFAAKDLASAKLQILNLAFE